MKKTIKGSVRQRIILIYFLLVFIAMAIVSVYLMSSMETNQLASLKQNIESSINQSNLLSTLSNYEPLDQNSGGLSVLLEESWAGGSTQEISIVGKNMLILASSNKTLQGKSAAAVLDADLLAKTFSKKTASEKRGSTGDIEILSLSYPAWDKSESKVIGAVYVRADLTIINQFLSTSKALFVRAIVLALIITVLLGFILARSITVPINRVTETAEAMSKGDFSKSVPVKSNDEIGQLAEMFNILREKLDATLEEISSEKNKLGTILEYMADGLIAIDLEGRILHANPQAREMLGIAEEADLSKASYDQLMSGVAEDLTLDKLKENCRDEGGQGVFEQDGRIFAVRYDRFKDEDAEDIGIIIIIQDITERQKLEDMQTDFVANVSHELKTPLTNIKSYTETLLDGALEDRDTADHFLEIINSEADRMNRLVKDLLQLSRLDNNQDITNIKETNAVMLVDTAVTKIQITAAGKNQQLNKLYDNAKDIRVNVDRDKFEQVILNVLTNAIKYTQEGGRIDVDVFEQAASCKIIVSDNGIGISAEALPRIFERFYRVDRARSRAMGGTGLGLAITKQIVENHGGTIIAESTEGKGTKMIIELPLALRKGVRNID